MEISLLLTPLGALLVASTCWAAPESGRSDEGCALTTCIPEECEMMGSVCVENSCGQLECVSPQVLSPLHTSFFPVDQHSTTMKYLFVCMVVICITSEQSLGMDMKERSKRATIEKGTSRKCPTLAPKPGMVCALYVSTQTCSDLQCWKQGKICCRDSCGHLRCVQRP
ncbi:hypothetical protein V5799_017047 [Amblyomma americanum]|uniref:Secreted protein n=1 Tax=Amblyomma americanum TaxID=6943 RepID=A0AAQ4F4F1_AMBAM